MIDRNRIFRSVSSMAVCSAVTAVVSMVQLSVLARFLTPRDYGLIAMPSILVSAFSVFLISIPLALIQREDITEEEISSMHQYVMYAGMFGYLLLLLVCGGMLFFIESTELVYVILALGLQLLITSLSITHQVLLRRDMLMEHVATAQITAVFVGCVVAVVSALMGAGYWTLVLATLARTVSSSIYIRRKSRRSTKQKEAYNKSAARGILGFGVSRGIDQILAQFTSKIDQMIIFGAMGQAAVGLYNVSSNIARRPTDLIQPIMGSVMFPMYSRLRLNRERFGAAFSDTVLLVALLIVGVASGISLLAPEVVALLLGDLWESAIPILAIIPFYFAFILIGVPCNEAAVANAKTKRLIVWNLLCAGVLSTAIGLAVYFYGSLFSVVLTAVVVRGVFLLVSFPYMLRGAGFVWLDPMLQLCLRVFGPLALFYLLLHAYCESSFWLIDLSERIIGLFLFWLMLLAVNVKYLIKFIRGNFAKTI